MRRRRAVITFVALASAATVVIGATQGCSIITSYDGFASTSSAAKTCGPRLPRAPSASAGPDDPAVLRGALQQIRFDAPDLGYDLDENCSKLACVSRGAAGTGGAVEAGVDNALGGFLKLFVQGDNNAVDRSLQLGAFGLFVELSKWNRQPDDSAVAVTLFNVVGVNTDSVKEARFDGLDTFVVDQSQVPMGSLPASSQDVGAYVNNGILVAHFRVLPLRLPVKDVGGTDGIFSAVFDEADLVGPISAGPNGLVLKGAQLVGRIGQKSILRGLGRIGYCMAGAPDGGPQLYEGVKQRLCGILDLTDSIATDGKGQKCSSVSFAIHLDFAATKPAPKTGPAGAAFDECKGEPEDTCP
jgi:hypothetical protein